MTLVEIENNLLNFRPKLFYKWGYKAQREWRSEVTYLRFPSYLSILLGQLTNLLTLSHVLSSQKLISTSSVYSHWRILYSYLAWSRLVCLHTSEKTLTLAGVFKMLKSSPWWKGYFKSLGEKSSPKYLFVFLLNFKLSYMCFTDLFIFLFFPSFLFVSQIFNGQFDHCYDLNVCVSSPNSDFAILPPNVLISEVGSFGSN